MKKILSVFLFTILAVSVTHAEGLVYTSDTGGPYKPTFTFSNTLRFNTKSNDVVELQKTLISKGYLKAGATGYFGKLTFAAVKAFQKDNKLKDDGIVGKVTKNLLIQEINAPISNGTPEVNLSPISTTVTTGGTIVPVPQSNVSATQWSQLVVNGVTIPYPSSWQVRNPDTSTCGQMQGIMCLSSLGQNGFLSYKIYNPSISSAEDQNAIYISPMNCGTTAYSCPLSSLPSITPTAQVHTVGACMEIQTPGINASVTSVYNQIINQVPSSLNSSSGCTNEG